VVDRQRDPGREAGVDALVFERAPEVVAALLACQRAGHRGHAGERLACRVDAPAVARLGGHLVDVLRADRRVGHVGVVGLEGARFPGDGDERRRVGAVEEGLCVGLVLAGVDDERARRVDDARPADVLARGFDLGQDADGEQAVDPCAGRRHHVVGGALLVALGVREVGVVELGGEQAVGDLAATRAALVVAPAHRETSASNSLARSAGSSATASKVRALRLAP